MSGVISIDQPTSAHPITRCRKFSTHIALSMARHEWLYNIPNICFGKCCPCGYEIYVLLKTCLIVTHLDLKKGINFILIMYIRIDKKFLLFILLWLTLFQFFSLFFARRDTNLIINKRKAKLTGFKSLSHYALKLILLPNLCQCFYY